MSSDPIFQRSLQDLIKGIRSNKRDPTGFVSQAIAEIKAELRSTDPFLKSEAVRKLTYLQMIGYNVSWASFSIVEVMSQPRFAHKRIAYLAANQTFDESTDVILLTTNLFKKEFSAHASANQYEIGLAVNCLANIATKELARDCIGDLVQLTSHVRPYVRKKAILAMYKLYTKYPQGLRLTFDQLKERLDDPESAVVSTAVNVICELAHKNAKNYLAMAPQFFRLLTTSANNWMLIKVVKLLGSLVPEEPRLARKLLDPLAAIIANTAAKSLEYECIYTLTEALPHSRREDGSEAKNAPAVITLCSTHLRRFLEETDPNLKYLGLVGLCNLLRTSPRSVVEHRDLVLACIGDEDTTIRAKALELLAGIVSQKSLIDLVQHLLQHAKHCEGSYRDEVISRILQMCRKDKYGCVTDFCWYVSVLLDLARMQGSRHGAEVAEQLMEVSLRVETVRAFAVESLLSMLVDKHAVEGHARETVVEALRAAAWVVGEYAHVLTRIARDVHTRDETDEEDEGETAFWIEAPRGEEVRSVWRGQRVFSLAVRTLLHARTTSLPARVQVVFLHTALKLFVRAAQDCDVAEMTEIVGALRTGLPLFLQSTDLEVQERASTFRQLLAVLAILPLDWEEQRERASPSGAEQSLLRLLPETGTETVSEIDSRGARQTLFSRRTLAALTAEQFYAVHSKAQRRVPPPDHVPLDVPLHSSALQKLLSVRLPEQESLSTLSLLKEPQSSKSIAPVLTAAMPLTADLASEERKEGPLVSASSSLVSTARPGGDEVFILSSKKKLGESSLSKLLGEGFEEAPPTAVRKKKENKDAKSRRRAPEIDTREMLPAGAVSSEDDREKRMSRRADKLQSTKNIGDEMDLGSVDITTPLRADEVISQPTHRPSSSAFARTESKRIDKEPKSDKKTKSKKEKAAANGDAQRKSPKKLKSKRKKDTDASFAKESVDLLALDWYNEQSSAAGMSASSTTASKTAPSSSFPQRLSTSSQCAISYSVSCVDREVRVHWRCVASSREAVSVRLSVEPNVAVSHFLEGQIVEIAHDLRDGASPSATSIFVLSQPLQQCVQLSCSVSITTASLLGPETSSSSARLVISPVSTFKSVKLSEEQFQQKLAKSSSKWASSSVQLSATSKPKTVFKILASLLHAHLVEVESHIKSATMSARTPTGCKIFVLVKVLSAQTVQVDVKCLGESKSESQQTVDHVCSALSELTI